MKLKRNSRIAVIAIAATITLTTATFVPAAALDSPDTAESDIAEAVELIEQLTGTTALVEVAPGESSESISVPETGEDPVTISAEGVEIEFIQPGDGDAEILVSDDGTISYLNEDEQFNTHLQVLESPDPEVLSEGVRSLIEIQDASAPREYEYPLTLDPGTTLSVLADGTVVGIREDEAVLVVPAPWALDADGTQVPTWYEIRGDRLIQHVDFTADHAFPVIADPVWFVPLIIAGARVLLEVALAAVNLIATVWIDDGHDDGSYYLESIGADPDQPLESLGYDEELGVEIFDSPLGAFYVDPDTADDAVDNDPLNRDPVIVPGVGEVDFVGIDIGVDDLSEEALAEFATAGIDVDELFGSSGTVHRATPVVPDPDLIRRAGDCEIGLGENVIARLEECAAAGGAETDGTDTVAETPATAAAARATTGSPPSGCASARSAKYISRTTGCIYNSKMVTLVNGRGASVGTLTVEGVAYVRTSTGTLTFENTAYVRLSTRTGAAAGRTFTFSGNTICAFNCMSQSGSATFTAANYWQSVRGTVAGDVYSGQSREVGSAWRFTITSPGVALSSVFNTLAVKPRCDNNTPQLTGRGCVFPSVVPVFQLSRSGAASGVATHVQKAINSGLTSNLTRASTTTINANRNKACPSSLKRDPGYQCDEYPFASSNQGAASGGSARVPDGCRWTAVAGYGSSGFSRCQVLTGQNGAGGTALDSFYRAQRVMVNDKYKVQITG